MQHRFDFIQNDNFTKKWVHGINFLFGKTRTQKALNLFIQQLRCSAQCAPATLNLLFVWIFRIYFIFTNNLVFGKAKEMFLTAARRFRNNFVSNYEFPSWAPNVHFFRVLSPKTSKYFRWKEFWLPFNWFILSHYMNDCPGLSNYIKLINGYKSINGFLVTPKYRNH